MQREAAPRQRVERTAGAPVEREETAGLARRCGGDFGALNDGHGDTAAAEEISGAGADHATAADHDVHGSRIIALQSIGSERGRGPRGNASSMRASSASVRCRPPAPAFSAACSAFELSGSRTPTAAASGTQRHLTRRRIDAPRRSRQARGPAGERGPGKSSWPNGLIGDDGDAVLLAPGDARRARSRAPRDGRAPDCRRCGLRPRRRAALRDRHVEVAHAPGEDLSGSDEALEGARTSPRADSAPRQCSR